MNKYQEALNEICSQCKHSPKCRMFKTKCEDFDVLQELVDKETGEEKYKLALFAVIRNSQVMPVGIKMGKSKREINRMSKETMKEIMNIINFQNIKEEFEQA